MCLDDYLLLKLYIIRGIKGLKELKSTKIMILEICWWREWTKWKEDVIENNCAFLNSTK